MPRCPELKQNVARKHPFVKDTAAAAADSDEICGLGIERGIALSMAREGTDV